ncbi:RagB/SusD family nutrient uptake outer membrane protein [Bacteroides congonensis]
MNRNLGITLLILLAGMFAGCEDFKLGNAFLEKPMSDDVNIDTVFAYKKYADQALNQVYRTLPDYLPLEARGYRGNWILTDGPTDICFSSSSLYTNGSISSSSERGFPFMLGSTTQNIGNSLYGIRKAYIYLENVDRVPDMTDAEKTCRKAEMKAIIAFHYSQMLRFYGGVPWIGHAYTSEDSFEFPRMTVEQTVNKIVELLDDAAGVLPWYASADEEGHMTAAAAKALKLRVLLFAASPLLNSEVPYADGEAAVQRLSWYGDYRRERWEAALDAGLEFLQLNEENGRYYKVINTGNPREDYVNGYWTRGSNEIILSSHRYAIYNMGMKSLDRGHNDHDNATRSSYADMFQWKDGSDFKWDNPEHRARPFFDENGVPNRDIRLYETLIINEDKFQNQPNGAECYQNGRQSVENAKFKKSSLYGYSIRKFVRDKGEEVKNKPYQCPLIRMPEVYLSIAESMNQLGLAKTADRFGKDAYDYINIVRTRAGLPELKKEAEGQELLNIILHERAVEFGAEEMRYFDLVRWKRGDLLSTPLESLVIKKGENDANGKPAFTYERSVSTQKYNWKEHWYLIAFPISEINKKYGLIQNPGW